MGPSFRVHHPRPHLLDGGPGPHKRREALYRAAGHDAGKSPHTGHGAKWKRLRIFIEEATSALARDGDAGDEASTMRLARKAYILR